MRKTLLLSGLIIAGLVLIFDIPQNVSVSVPTQNTAPADIPAGAQKAKTESKSAIQESAAPTPTAPVAPVTTKSLTLIAGEAKYAFAVPEGATLYENMVLLASSTSFTFTSKEFSGLGYRIESINGKANAGGTYWTLYINSEYSNVGASTYMPKEGDIIEWKYIRL